MMPGVAPNDDPDLLALDEALSELARVDERKAQVVEMRFFGGLTERNSCRFECVARNCTARLAIGKVMVAATAQPTAGVLIRGVPP
jgi:hypothetical protein